MPEAPDVDLPHVGPLGDAPRRVQGAQGRAERADLIGARLFHLADDVHLVCAHVGDGDVEAGSRVRPAFDPRVNSTEPRVQHVAQVLEGQVRHEYLAYLLDQDEALPGDRQRVRELHVAGQDQHEHIAGSELVVGRHGASEQGEELRGRPPEHVCPKDVCNRRVGARVD